MKKKKVVVISSIFLFIFIVIITFMMILLNNIPSSKQKLQNAVLRSFENAVSNNIDCDYETSFIVNLKNQIDCLCYSSQTGYLVKYQGETFEVNNQGIAKIKDGNRYVDNVQVLKSSSLDIGETIYTLGYYKANDGGEGAYKIVNALSSSWKIVDDGMAIKIDDNKYAELIVVDKTVSVLQFGAKKSNQQNIIDGGDCDNSKIIASATNAVTYYDNLSYVYFPNGKYRYDHFVRIKSSNINIIGLGATLYVDNNYEQTASSSSVINLVGTDNHLGEVNEWSFQVGGWNIYDDYNLNKEQKIMSYSTVSTGVQYRTDSNGNAMYRYTVFSDSVVLKNLDFEVLSTHKTGFKIVFGLTYISNVKLYNVNINIPDSIYNEEDDSLVQDESITCFNAICFDAYTGWNNIEVKNSSFSNMAGLEWGGSFGLRDIYEDGYDCDKFVADNCTIISNCHDEVIAIFAGRDTDTAYTKVGDDYDSISNVTIKNCKITGENQPQNIVSRTVFLTVGYQIAPVYNITYLNNSFYGHCATYFSLVGNTHNFTFENNNVEIDSCDNNVNSIYGFYHRSSLDGGDIFIKGNQITFGNKTQIKVKSLYNLSAGTFENNNISIKGDCVDNLFSGTGDIKNNIVNISGDCSHILYQVYKFTNNNIKIYGTLLGCIYKMYIMNLSNDILLDENTFDYNVASSCCIIMLNGSTGVKTNGYKFSVNNCNFIPHTVNALAILKSYTTKDESTFVVSLTNCQLSTYVQTNTYENINVSIA